MKSYVAVSLTATTLAASAVALSAIANAAPSGPSTVDQTVRTLEASGYNVIVNRTGGAQLSQCSVSSVRPGQTHSTTDSRGGSSLNTTITSKTVYVDVTC
jgi:NADPH:quinone reductase-like Zn-dependent oxidoreductase